MSVESRKKTATIANGASLSDAIDIEGARRILIQMPAAWDAANLTFQSSDESGGTYQNLYDQGGTEITVTAAAARSIGVNNPALLSARFLKIRSGTSGAAVNQTAERAIVVLIQS